MEEHINSVIRWDGSFEHTKHMLKQMSKKLFTILLSKILFILIYANVIVIFYFQDFDSDSDWDVSPVEGDDQ